MSFYIGTEDWLHVQSIGGLACPFRTDTYKWERKPVAISALKVMAPPQRPP